MNATSTFCLSRAEIADLTRAHTRRKQIAFLRSNGIRHYVDDHGRPVVTRSAVEGDRDQAQDSIWNPAKAA